METYAFSLENVAWSVADDEVTTISETGVVTAISTGETDITATAEDGATAVCHVLVDAAIKGLHFPGLHADPGPQGELQRPDQIFTEK